MGLKQDLMAALKEAMQKKDTLKKETITMLRAAILQVEKDTLKELSEAEMGTIVAKEVKKRKESIADFEKGGREDLIAQTNEEIAILQEYLPKQLTKEEIKAELEKVIADLGATSMKDMGPVMKEAKARIGAAADGRTINDVVKELLG